MAIFGVAGATAYFPKIEIRGGRFPVAFWGEVFAPQPESPYRGGVFSWQLLSGFLRSVGRGGLQREYRALCSGRRMQAYHAFFPKGRSTMRLQPNPGIARGGFCARVG